MVYCVRILLELEKGDNMQKQYSIFDITGPILIGPSSSHTAGACRLANAARAILNQDVTEVTIYLYGSFAKTLYGHGTDKALVGGILGIAPDDERLTNALVLAKDCGLLYKFVFDDTQLSSANVVLFDMKGHKGGKMRVRGVSIGGGSIIVDRINDTTLQISLKYNTIVVDHRDKPGAVLSVSRILAENEINIASMNMYRQAKHDRAYMIIEIDQDIEPEVLGDIRELPDMSVIYIYKLY